MPHLSVVIPAYNEAERLPQTLDVILSFLKSQPYDSEILISDDGSTDRTVSIAESKLIGFSHKILTTPQNKGKGHAVRQGMLAATGDYVLFTDADLSTPIEEVTRFLPFLSKEWDLAIGSRAIPGAHIEIRQNWGRELMGRIFNLLARIWTFRSISDSQCGFKCFRREVAQKLFGAQKLDGFGFDVEIVYLAQKMGLRLLELPVTWRNSAKSRVRIFQDPILMFRDILRIRKLHG